MPPHAPCWWRWVSTPMSWHETRSCEDGSEPTSPARTGPLETLGSGKIRSQRISQGNVGKAGRVELAGMVGVWNLSAESGPCPCLARIRCSCCQWALKMSGYWALKMSGCERSPAEGAERPERGCGPGAWSS